MLYFTSRKYTDGRCCVLPLFVDFTHIIQGHYTDTGEIMRLPKCLLSDHDEYE